MNRRPNRVVLLLTGLLLVAAGTVALLAADGILAVPEPAELYEQAAASAAAYPREWAAGAVVGGLLVAAVGAWLVQRQLKVRRGGRLSTVTVDRGERGGTTLQAAAVARAVAGDLRARRGVVDSDVRMITFGSRPRLLVSLSINAQTEPRTALDRAEEVYQRVGRVLGRDVVHVDTRVGPSREPSSRVE